MMASDDGLRGLVPDPPGGLVGIDDAVSLSLSGGKPRPVDGLADPHHLADTDPDWAGGDVLRIRRFAAMVTPAVARPCARTARHRPRTGRGRRAHGLDTLIGLAPKSTIA